MFTGLIKGIGTVVETPASAAAAQLRIKTALASELPLGASIAVNGVCLTVAQSGPGWFKAALMPPTLQSTNLGQLRSGSQVNLEPALQLGEALGGHLVSGHIDGVGKIVDLKSDRNGLQVRIKAAPELVKRLVPKGSVAVNGVSLTVQELATTEFMVELIPHTVAQTTFNRARRGDPVNLETDLLGKFIQNNSSQTGSGVGPKLTPEFLAEHGFIS